MAKFMDPDFDTPDTDDGQIVMIASSRLFDLIHKICEGNGTLALSIVGSLFASVLENSDTKNRIEGIKLLKEIHESALQRYQ